MVVSLALIQTDCGVQLSRFFKSAAFPILLVILLAFFVQKLFYGSRSTEADDLQRVPDGGRAENVKDVVRQDQGSRGRGRH